MDKGCHVALDHCSWRQMHVRQNIVVDVHNSSIQSVGKLGKMKPFSFTMGVVGSYDSETTAHRQTRLCLDKAHRSRGRKCSNISLTQQSRSKIDSLCQTGSTNASVSSKPMIRCFNLLSHFDASISARCRK